MLTAPADTRSVTVHIPVNRRNQARLLAHFRTFRSSLPVPA